MPISKTGYYRASRKFIHNLSAIFSSSIFQRRDEDDEAEEEYEEGVDDVEDKEGRYRRVISRNFVFASSLRYAHVSECVGSFQSVGRDDFFLYKKIMFYMKYDFFLFINLFSLM